jgi:hypothetical protein
VEGGFFDGPRAHRMVMRRLEGLRSKMDKDRKADYLQRTSHLVDGCSAAEYTNKALAYLVHIHPHMPYAPDDDDTTSHLIGMMPKALREGGRRILHELTLVGRQHDFYYVVRRCSELVSETIHHWLPDHARWCFDCGQVSASTLHHYVVV